HLDDGTHDIGTRGPSGRVGRTVERKPGQRITPERPERAGTAAGPKLVGSGWTTVAVVPGAGAGTADGTAGGGQLAALLARLPQVSGSRGSGRDLRGSLLTAVLPDDGRLAVGAVEPALIYRALGAR